MRDYTRITVALSKDEFTALSEAASKEYRHPREQARWLLRQLLVQDDEQPAELSRQTQNDAGRNRQEVASAVL